ncbi:hypothetical protein DPMN_191873 [Dreissena polymorpha]|uniref:Uncharacterized protein n=1 Tax=Dreissena polymorpha TaxID=45954 RepID=A0A9D3XXL6_DREPO|nr:hypothetical protein DPMN_191873 [Dreissena polymorpha]
MNEDHTLNMTSFAHLREKTANPGSNVIQLIGTIFKLNSQIKETNVLTKFHENWAKNVTSRVFTCFHYTCIHIEKNAPPTGGHVFSPIWTIFKLVHDINKTNVLTNFHDDWAKIVTSRVFTSSHVIQLTGTIFKLKSHAKKTNVLTKFHENWAKNVTSRVENIILTDGGKPSSTGDQPVKREKIAPPTGGHVFSPIWTIFELVREINKNNVLNNFHDDWAKIVTSRVFTSHVIQLTGTIFALNSHIKETIVLTKFHENWAKNVTFRTIFKLVRDINKTNVLTNFHDDRAKIVTSRVFTRKIAPFPPPPGSHVIQLTGTIFKLNSPIRETNKNAQPTGGHAFSPIWTIFELVRDIKITNVLTNFHDEWATIVTSRVLTRKTALPTRGHVFQRTGTTFELDKHIINANILTNFELDRDIIRTNLLTKFQGLQTKRGRRTDGRTKTGHKCTKYCYFGRTHRWMDRRTGPIAISLGMFFRRDKNDGGGVGVDSVQKNCKL